MKGSSSKILGVLVGIAACCVIIAAIFLIIYEGETAKTQSGTEVIERIEQYEQIKSNPKYQEALDYAFSKNYMLVYWKTEGDYRLYVDTKYRTVYFYAKTVIPRMLPDGSVETFEGDWLEIGEIRKLVEKYLKNN